MGPGPQHVELTLLGQFFMLWAAFEATKGKREKRQKKGRRRWSEWPFRSIEEKQQL